MQKRLSSRNVGVLPPLFYNVSNHQHIEEAIRLMELSLERIKVNYETFGEGRPIILLPG
jgi:hypothetical protein